MLKYLSVQPEVHIKFSHAQSIFVDHDCESVHYSALRLNVAVERISFRIILKSQSSQYSHQINIRFFLVGWLFKLESGPVQRDVIEAAAWEKVDVV